MGFLYDRCIQEINVPIGEGTQLSEANCCTFDYNSELNLIVAFVGDIGEVTVVVWDPDTGKLIKGFHFDVETMSMADVILLHERCIVVAYCGERPMFKVYSIDSGENIMEVIDDKSDLNFLGLCVVAHSPENGIILNSCMTEYFLDLNTKVVNDRELFFLQGNTLMCCAKLNYTLCCDKRHDREHGFYCLNIEFLSDGETSSTIEYITHCMIGNERRDLRDNVTGLAHDGENIIVATSLDILLLESAENESTAHVIVPSGFVRSGGQMRVNHKKQLMVCDGSDVIKVYEYKQYDTLQALCRHVIHSLLKENKEKITKLPLPNPMKNYLLYK